MISGELFGTHDFFAFLIAGIALNLVPGQDTLYIAGRSLAQGRKAGIVSVLGVGSGCLVHITVAALGLYAILTLFPLAFETVVVLGGLYLIWLGISTWMRQKSARPGFVPAARAESLWPVYIQGFLTNLLNPKMALFFLAFLPQFIDHAAGSGAISFLFLGGTFMITGTIWCMIIALCASAFAEALRDNPKKQLGFDLFASILFIGMGAVILLTHL
jgi:threonine/homoserine/homoserine lactone efflux protein